MDARELFSVAVANARDEFEQPAANSAAAEADYIAAEASRLRGLIAAALASHDARVTA